MENITSPQAQLKHVGGTLAPKHVRVVATWPAGTFLENLAIDKTGAIFITVYSHNRIDRYDPATGKTTTFAELPARPMGVAFDSEGQLWVTGGTFFEAPGYFWKIAQNGSVQQWAVVPDALFMNGCTIHPNKQTLLACDSLTGRVLGIDMSQPERWSAWLTDDLLKPGHPHYPGANGIKFINDTAYISVSGRYCFVRTKLRADGSPGQLETSFTNILADDFAFGESGSLYVTTHPEQTVVHVDPSGNRTTIAGPEEGAVGSTACAFGRLPSDKNSIYVTTEGGIIVPYNNVLQEAKLLRIDVGEPGID